MISIQICQLNGLLVFTGDGSRIFKARHGLVHGFLHMAVGLGSFGDTVHLINGAHGTAAGQSRRQQQKHAKTYSLFHGIHSSLLSWITVLTYRRLL